jgi:hypothetical protein
MNKDSLKLGYKNIGTKDLGRFLISFDRLNLNKQDESKL